MFSRFSKGRAVRAEFRASSQAVDKLIDKLELELELGRRLEINRRGVTMAGASEETGDENFKELRSVRSAPEGIIGPFKCCVVNMYNDQDFPWKFTYEACSHREPTGRLSEVYELITKPASDIGSSSSVRSSAETELLLNNSDYNSGEGQEGRSEFR
ncbi:hypothetical protein R1sor_025921 [Riccia sorocarpa]|uniref:Pheromone receptor n=1 Tax=Riccia sorocarpa TaxID=122646 RepID=A0ABD3G9Y7_9MARC